MSSCNCIGTQWAGACSNLMNTVLRDEWGFQGAVLTDCFANFGCMDATRSIHNGGDSCLINRDKVVIATKFGIRFDMDSPLVNKPLNAEGIEPERSGSASSPCPAASPAKPA